MPVLDIKVVDTTGAGDAFTSGFLSYIIKAGGLGKVQENPELMKEAAQYGAATGALTCTGKGGIAPTPTPEQVDEILKTVARS